MKIIVFGDIHGRTCWKDIVQKESFDKVVFLGDYVSTHYDISEQDQIENLREILQFKRDNPNDVILLRGNHDMQHCGFGWAECSGYFINVEKWMMENIEEFLTLTQWVYVEDNIIFSHAGISKTWYEKNQFASIESINKEEPTCVFAFTPDNWRDSTGTSKTQPLTWIRPQSLVNDMLDGYSQVVGHTPVTRISEIKQLMVEYNEAVDNINDKLWCCDNLPKQYLEILTENNLFTVKDI